MRAVKPQGYVAKLSRDCQVFIPFVCKRCGECCRKAGVNWRYMNFHKIGKYLGLTPKEVVIKYLAEDGPSNVPAGERKTKPQYPCPFLKGNDCGIYPVRPGPCESFPVETNFGGRGVECPGEKEAVRSWRSLRSGSVQPASCSAELSHVPPDRWDKILARYLKSNPSKEALELFIKFNRPAAADFGTDST